MRVPDSLFIAIVALRLARARRNQLHRQHTEPLLFSSFMDLRPATESSFIQSHDDGPAVDGKVFMKASKGEEKDALEAWLGPAPKGPTYGDVPSKVHMIHVSDTSPEWHLFHFLHVNAALKTHKPEVLYIYYHTEPHGDFWKKTLDLPGVQRVQMESDLYRTFLGHEVNEGAHQADKLRLMTLLRHGGIYLDTDVLSLRDLAPLRNASFLKGACAFMGEEPGGLGNSLIGSTPNCPFLRLWWKNYTDFDDKIWAEHSIIRPGKLRKDHSSLLKVMPMKAFTPYYPSVRNAPGLFEAPGWFEQNAKDKLKMPGVDRLIAKTTVSLLQSVEQVPKLPKCPARERGEDCGFPTIDEKQCKGKEGCCWDPDSSRPGPWCYYMAERKAEESDVPFTMHLFSAYNGEALSHITEQGRCRDNSLYNKLTRLTLPCSPIVS